MHFFLHFLHVAAVVLWVGGMFFAHACLRPALAELAPPQRLALMHQVLRRFFAAVTPAVLVILGSGFAMLAEVGFAAAPAHWHAMAAIGLVMAAIYGLIRGRFFPRLAGAVAGADWPAAATALARIRQLVLANLLLGGFTIGVATLGPLWAGR